MAEMSAETKAIIDRLKAEGDLIRNTGTNSIRSVGIQLAKFDGLFNSINANIAEQTSIMKAQLGLAEDAAESARTREQFEEVQPKDPPERPSTRNNDDSESRSRTDEKINSMGDAIASALSLKNIALGAAGMFVGYNLLKGFVDEKTGGGFTAFETNLGNMARQLGETDFSALRTTLTDLPGIMTDLKTTFTSISESLAKLTKTIDDIMAISWGDIFTAVATSIGLLTAYNLTMRAILGAQAAGGILGGGRRGFMRRLLAGGLGAAGLATVFGANDPDVKAAAADADANARADRNRLTPDQRAALGGYDQYRTAPTPSTRPPSAMTDAPDAPNIRIETDANGRTTYRGPDGRFMSPTVAVPQLNAAGLAPDGLPNVQTTTPTPTPRYGGRGDGAAEMRARSGEAGKAIAEANRGLIKRLAASKIGKVILTGIPLAGAVIGAGFAVYNIIRGDFTSAALNVASIPLPTISGTALDIGSVATEIFFDVTGETYNQADPDHRALMIEIGNELKVAYDEWMENRENERRREFDALPEEERARREAAMERAAMGEFAFADSGYAPDLSQLGAGTNYNTGQSTGGIGADPNFRGNYYTDRNGVLMWQPPGGGMPIRASQRPDISTVEQAGGGGGGAVVINAPTDARQNITVSDGGNTVAVQNLTGGGGGAFSIYGLGNPYGLNMLLN